MLRPFPRILRRDLGKSEHLGLDQPGEIVVAKPNQLGVQARIDGDLLALGQFLHDLHGAFRRDCRTVASRRVSQVNPHSPYGTLIVPPYITLTHYNYSRYNL